MEKIRSSGIILPVFSLPSRFGIGDLGPEAYRFADFLAHAGVRYWQILPLVYTDAGCGYSPYSGLSAFAGNVMLISPEMLLREQLLHEDDLEKQDHGDAAAVNYEKVYAFKNSLFEKAFQNFKTKTSDAYVSFCKENAWWLDDFALFKSLKDHLESSSWNEWPQPLKERDPEALRERTAALSDRIEKEKFLQFLFFNQWDELKKYCAGKGIFFIGDMPFFVNYESADVWSYPEYFKLGKDKRIQKSAGTPPDDFSSTGQLWGMPVYNWEALEKNNYDWWLKRIEQNLRVCNLLRLDHFRAFAACWEIPAQDKTAENGAWCEAPGKSFFDIVKQHLPDLPFIAEDLGTIDQAVLDLRDHFQLPGMKVLQFAFNGDPANVYLPYYHTENSIVYTGTHDNNTTKGWFKSLDEQSIKQLAWFANQKISAENIHEALVRLAMQSSSRIAVVPLQDLLGLGEEAIINKPSTQEGNWKWRLQPSQYNEALALEIRNLLKAAGRFITSNSNHTSNMKDKENIKCL